MRILIVTDAWFPQTNGVVSTLAQTAAWLGRFGHRSAHHQSPRLPQHRVPDVPGNPLVPPTLQAAAKQHSCVLAAGHAHCDRRAAGALPPGDSACGTACDSPPRITRSSRSICARAFPCPEPLLSRAALVSWRGRALHGEHGLGAPRSCSTRIQESRALAPRRRHRDVQAARKRFPEPAAPDRRLCRPRRRREKHRRLPENALEGNQDRDRRRAGARAARKAISGRGILRLSIRRGSCEALGGRRCHGVSEPHRHLRPRQSRSHGLRRAGGRVSGDRAHRCGRGRRNRRARCRSCDGGAARSQRGSSGLPRARLEIRVGRVQPRIREQPRALRTQGLSRN